MKTYEIKQEDSGRIKQHGFDEFGDPIVENMMAPTKSPLCRPIAPPSPPIQQVQRNSSMPEFYPVTMYFWDGRAIVCGSPGHKEALGKGWCSSLSAATQLHEIELKEAEEAGKPKRAKNAGNSASN